MTDHKEIPTELKGKELLNNVKLMLDREIGAINLVLKKLISIQSDQLKGKTMTDQSSDVSAELSTLNEMSANDATEHRMSPEHSNKIEAHMERKRLTGVSPKTICDNCTSVKDAINLIAELVDFKHIVGSLYRFPRHEFSNTIGGYSTLLSRINITCTQYGEVHKDSKDRFFEFLRGLIPVFVE